MSEFRRGLLGLQLDSAHLVPVADREERGSFLYAQRTTSDRALTIPFGSCVHQEPRASLVLPALPTPLRRRYGIQGCVPPSWQWSWSDYPGARSLLLQATPSTRAASVTGLRRRNSFKHFRNWHAQYLANLE